MTARWIFPISGPPLAQGTITIQEDRILAVDKSGSRTPDIDLGNVAILPGFVNAHTHLDLSDALGRCPPLLISPPGCAPSSPIANAKLRKTWPRQSILDYHNVCALARRWWGILPRDE